MINTEQADRLAEAAAGHEEQPDVILQPADRAATQLDTEVKEPDRLDDQFRWCNWTVLATFTLCIFVSMFFRSHGPFGAAPNAAIGQTLSRLELQPLIGDGQPVTLADLTGRVVLISFWRSGSQQSGDVLSRLAAVDKQFGDQSAFRLFSVACNRLTGENRRTLRHRARTLLNRQGIELPIHADLNGTSRAAIGELTGRSSYPTTLVIDRLGRIRGVWIGFGPDEQAAVEQTIAQLLAEG